MRQSGVPSWLSRNLPRGCDSVIRVFFAALFLILFSAENLLPGLEGSGKFGFPVIRNFMPRDYKAHSQNWAITRDERGVMYFGNSYGVLEYDGITWNLIRVPNQIVRSLACADNGTIYAGSADDFGYLKRERDGRLVYTSLLSHAGVSGPVGHIWYTFASGSSVYFISNNYIFRYSFPSGAGSKPQVESWKPRERFRAAHQIGNDIYVLETGAGLKKFSGGSLRLIPGSEQFADKMIAAMIPFDDLGRILLGTREVGLHLFDGSTFTPFRSEAAGFLLKENMYISRLRLTDGSFVFTTTRGGIIIIDKNGDVVHRVNKSNGIPDNGVLFAQQYGNILWLALQNGISAVELPSPAAYINQTTGLEGSVSDVLVSGGNLYAATTAGLFSVELKNRYLSQNDIRRITVADAECWSLLETGNSLLVATSDNLLRAEGNRVAVVPVSWSRIYFLYQSVRFPERIYAGLEDGVAVIENRAGKWFDRGKIPGITTAVRNLAEDSLGNIWLGTAYYGLFRISLTSPGGFSSPSIRHFPEEEIPRSGEVRVFRIGNDLLVSTGARMLRYDYKTGQLIPDDIYNFSAWTRGSDVITELKESSGTLWAAAVTPSSELRIGTARKTGGTYQWSEPSALRGIIDFSNNNAVFRIYPDEKNRVIWLCGADGIVSYKPEFSPIDTLQTPPAAVIRKVSLRGDSLLFAGDDLLRASLQEGDGFILSHEENSIRFSYSGLTFDAGLTRYQYILEGLEETWSPRTDETSRDYTSLPPGSYIFRVRAVSASGLTGAESTFTFTILHPWYSSWYMYLFYLLLAVLAVVGLLRWTTDYLIRRNLRLEAIIADRTKIISEQAEKLRHLDEIKSRFFANISHEFRTPLTLTLGQIESVMESTSERGLKQKLEMSFRNAKKLLKLVNQILEITRLESQEQKLKLVSKDIVAFCRHLFYNFESYADNQGITLRFTSEDESLRIPFDPEKMEKVMVNLLGNAVKFTSSGGSVQLHISRIRSLSIDEQEQVKISVEDTGIGIPADRLPYIFDRFYQVERTGRSELEGTGIGLSLVKELVDLHGGNISVESTEGRGSVFSVILPLVSSQSVQEELSGEEASLTREIDIYTSPSLFYAPHQHHDADRDLVLVVDDNSDIRQFIREQLEDSFSVLEAHDGLQGFDSARESIPNLIITDVRMPGMDGFTLSKKLKEDPLTSHIPVIILTAKSEEEDRLTGLETGADDYLVKPFSTKELLLRTRNLIAGRKKIIEKFSRTASFNPSEVSASDIDRRFLEKVQSEITSSLADENFSAEILASKCSVSVSQLNRKLKGLIGQPAGQLIRSARMEKAALLLQKGDYPIKEIALMVGFSDQSTFTRAFSRYFGKAPGEFTQN